LPPARGARDVDAASLFGSTETGQVHLRNADVSDEAQARALIAYATEVPRRNRRARQCGGHVRRDRPGEGRSRLRVEGGVRHQPDGLATAAAISPCRRLVRAKRGFIVNVAGGGSTGPLENFSCYAASKAALARFTDTLARELQAAGSPSTRSCPARSTARMQDQLLAAESAPAPGIPR